MIPRSTSFTTSISCDSHLRSKSAMGLPPYNSKRPENVSAPTPPPRSITTPLPRTNATKTTPFPKTFATEITPRSCSNETTLNSPPGMPTPPLPASRPPLLDVNAASSDAMQGSFLASPARVTDVTKEITRELQSVTYAKRLSETLFNKGVIPTEREDSAAAAAAVARTITNKAKTSCSKNLQPIPFTPIIPQPIFKSFSSSQRYSSRFADRAVTTCANASSADALQDSRQKVPPKNANDKGNDRQV